MYTNITNPSNYQLQAFDQYGFRILPAGMSASGSGVEQYRSFLATEDSVINTVSLHGDDYTNKTLLAGEELFGLFTDVEVLSGEIIGYLAGPISVPQNDAIWFNFDGIINYASFPDSSFSLNGSSICFGTWVRPFSVDINRQVILMADSFSIEIRGKYLYVINGAQEIKVCDMRAAEWKYISLNISGTTLTAYTVTRYTIGSNTTTFTNTYTYAINAVDLSSVTKLRIGADFNAQNLLYGNLSYFGFWERTLTLPEILVFYFGPLSSYPASATVDLVHFYEFSYWLAFGITALATDKILVSPINGTVNGL